MRGTEGVGNPVLYHNNLDALAFYQTSAEADALYYQAFALGELRLLSGLERRRQAGATENSLYVISDCDETLLDNSDYNGWLIETGRDFHDTSWSEWCQARRARATPGAVEFCKFVVEHGASLIYVTSRFEVDRVATAQVLRELGFPLEDASTDPDRSQLFLANMVLAGKATRKREQFQHLLKRFGAEPILQLGDNLSDHEPNRYSGRLRSEQRRDSARQDALRWGSDWIVFPNPVYGGWRTGLPKADEDPPAPFQEGPVRPPASEAPKLGLLRRWQR